MNQRRAEVRRIKGAMIINPLQILGLRTDATGTDVRAQYKRLSMLVHPDKCASDFIEEARSAFERLNAARDELLDDTKRGELNELIVQARDKIIAKRQAASGKPAVAAAAAVSGSDEAAPDASLATADHSKDPKFEEEVARELQEILIEIEFRRKVMLRTAAQREAQEAEERAKRRAQTQEKANDEKEWEQSRENRVNDWRSFISGNKKARVMKPPTARGEDAAIAAGKSGTEGKAKGPRFDTFAELERGAL